MEKQTSSGEEEDSGSEEEGDQKIKRLFEKHQRQLFSPPHNMCKDEVTVYQLTLLALLSMKKEDINGGQKSKKTRQTAVL